MKMTLEQFLVYAKDFEGRRYGSIEAVTADVQKIKNLMDRFGFTYYRSFSAYTNNFNSTKPDTTFFYRVQAGDSEYGYIEIQLGHLVKNKGFEGVFRTTDNSKPDLNPRTKAPWQIGDIKHINQYYSVTLTRNGWYSGD